MSDLYVTRRQLLRLALMGSVTLATSAVVVSGPFALSIFAGQLTSPVLHGVRPDAIPGGSSDEAVPLFTRTLDLPTGAERRVAVPPRHHDGVTPVLNPTESITGCAALADGTLVLSITPTPGTSRATEPTRLTRLIQPAPTSTSVSGLAIREKLVSIVATQIGTLIGIVGDRNGDPPYRMVTLDPQSGATNGYANLSLPTDRRLTTLASGPDGHLYSTAVGTEGETNLVQLDTGRSQVLTSNGAVWNSGMASLTFAPGGQLFALGAPRYKTPYSLYTLDVISGALTRVRELDVVRLTSTLA
jgi:hypothetical protein